MTGKRLNYNRSFPSLLRRYILNMTTAVHVGGCRSSWYVPMYVTCMFVEHSNDVVLQRTQHVLYQNCCVRNPLQLAGSKLIQR